MTRKRIRQLVAETQRRMLCEHWNVTLVFDAPRNGGTAEAATAWAFQFDQADLILFNGWKAWDEDKARHVLTHEFGHLLMRDLQVAIRDQQEFMDEDAWDQFWARFNHEQEGLVDRYATIICNGRKP